VGGVRWYLLTVIDFFSRWIIAFDVVPTVHADTSKPFIRQGSTTTVPKPFKT
jgi:hypothetical protein